MKLTKLYVMLLASAAVLTGESMATQCGSDAALNDRDFVLVNVRNATAGTLCSTLTTQIRPYAGADANINGNYDTAIIITGPSINPTRTIDAVDWSCARHLDGSLDTEDIKGDSQIYSGHVMVLINNNEALPARIVQSAWVRGSLPKKGSKWSKLYPLNAGVGSPSAHVCMMTNINTGVDSYYCPYCTSKLKGND